MGRKSNYAELRKAVSEISLEEFISTYYNETIDTLNFNLKSLSFLHNFPSKVVTVTISAGQTARIFHEFGIVPSSRVILRNSGDGAITDGEYTNKYVELINRGSIEATVKVAILRG